MPSDRVYLLKHGKHVPMKHTSSGGMVVGGAVALLLNTQPKTSLLEGKGMLGANKIVGIYSPAPPKQATDIQTAKMKPTVFQGGDLLNRIAFEPYMKKGSRDNIKFLF